MKKVFSGSSFKKWFKSKPDIKRVLIPTRDSFHILNLDEINDNEFYIMSERAFGEVVIEEVELIQ